MFDDRLRNLRKAKNATQAEVAEAIGIGESAYSNYEKDLREPNAITLKAMSKYFGVTIDYLLDCHSGFTVSDAEQEHIKKYRALDERGKKMIDMVLDLEYTNSQEQIEEEVIQTNCIVLTMYEDAVSAGTGEFLNDGRCVEITVDETPLTERADFVLRVAGDSMQPTYYDGDKVLVESAEELRYGDIGIFILNGEGYIKEYRPEGLYSHNTKYGIIKVTDNDNCRIIGKVIGKI